MPDSARKIELEPISVQAVQSQAKLRKYFAYTLVRSARYARSRSAAIRSRIGSRTKKCPINKVIRLRLFQYRALIEYEKSLSPLGISAFSRKSGSFA